MYFSTLLRELTNQPFPRAGTDAPVMIFSWNPSKALENQRKHRVTFAEAMTVFGDPLSLTGFDAIHSQAEDRFVTMGTSVAGRLLVVVHADRLDEVRIISARVATRRERKDYEDGQFP